MKKSKLLSSLPAQDQIMQLLFGPLIAKSINVAAKFNIADLISEGGPKTADYLAKSTGLDPTALYRILRALASLDIFRETESGKFENTPLSETLTSTHPNSIRDYAIYAVHDGNMKTWSKLEEVVHTGKSIFIDTNGCNPWDYFKQNPEVSEVFNRAMTNLSKNIADAFIESYNFADCESICDVGGGQGFFLSAILEKTPEAKGILFDLPHVIESAKKYLESNNVQNRIQLISGNLFESIPKGYSVYIVKHILHDWNDEKCLEILKSLRKAIPANGKLIILDALISEGNELHPSKWLDLHMMASLDGKERSEADFNNLLSKTGFQLEMATPLIGIVGIIEAIPV